MKIQYCSDLHLEFPENLRAMKSSPLQPVGDILILAGDTVPLSLSTEVAWFWDWASDNFETTFCLPGNHEYYGSSITEKDLTVHEAIRSNVIMLNNRSIEIDKCTIHFSTLWSSISPSNANSIEHKISDFHRIRFNDKNLGIGDVNFMHTTAVAFLEQALTKPSTKTTIVVTHHVPTRKNYPREFYASALRDAFSVELEDRIAQWQPDYWIYGHHHRNTPVFEIGKTRLLTNQVGYVHMGESSGFERNKVITIDHHV